MPDPQPLAEQPEVRIELSAIPSNPIQLLVKEEPASTEQNDPPRSEKDIITEISNERADSFDGLQMSNLEGLSDFKGPYRRTGCVAVMLDENSRNGSSAEFLEQGWLKVQADLLGSVHVRNFDLGA
jgi:hypothetical protein